MKKTIFFSIFIVFLFTACDSKLDKVTKSVNPEEFLHTMYYDLINDKITYQDIYDNLFADISKKLFLKDEYIEAQNTQYPDLISEDLVLTDITTALVAKYDTYNITEINTTLTYSINGVPVSKEIKDYVIKINGEYKYLYNGVLNKKLYTMKTFNDGYEFHSESAVVYNTASGLVIDINMVNDSEKNFAFGFDSCAKVSIETDESKYVSNLNQIYTLNSDGKVTLSAIFNEASGTVTKFAISNIYTLNAVGQPIEVGTGLVYSVHVT